MIRAARGVLLLPVRALAGGLAILLRPVTRRVDRSPWVGARLSALSSSMATQRGLLLMIGTGLLVLSLIAHAVTVFALVATGTFEQTVYWLCIPVALLHVGVLIGFTGAMLATPLGQGYREH